MVNCYPTLLTFLSLNSVSCCSSMYPVHRTPSYRLLTVTLGRKSLEVECAMTLDDKVMLHPYRPRHAPTLCVCAARMYSAWVNTERSLPPESSGGHRGRTVDGARPPRWMLWVFIQGRSMKVASQGAPEEAKERNQNGGKAKVTQ